MAKFFFRRIRGRIIPILKEPRVTKKSLAAARKRREWDFPPLRKADSIAARVSKRRLDRSMAISKAMGTPGKDLGKFLQVDRESRIFKRKIKAGTVLSRLKRLKQRKK